MDYDLIIIGAGPAGLSAGLFAGRRKLKTLILEGKTVGGEMGYATTVENYPGVAKTTGMKLAKEMRRQAEEVDCKIVMENAVELNLKGSEKKVKTKKEEYTAKAVIVATGSSYRYLGIPGEKELIGKGVSYCASCDAPLFKDKAVAVIGGSDTAARGALFLIEYASKVYLVHRRDELRAVGVLCDKLKASKVEILWDNIPKEIKGSNSVEGLVIENVKSKETQTLKVGGVFVLVGSIPTTELAKKAGVKVDEKNFIAVDTTQETNIAGVYAAGDVTGGIQQIAEAVGEGATAATKAYEYIKNQ